MFNACSGVVIFVLLGMACLSPPLYADDSGVLFPLGEQPPPSSSDGGMSVTTRKIKSAKKRASEVKPIELLSPRPDADFTPGMATFNWKIRNDVKKGKFVYTLENLETGRKLTKEVRAEEV